MSEIVENVQNATQLEVSWLDFHRHSIQLAKMVHDKGPWKAVVGVSRGGLVPAAIVARELEIRLVGVISIASYHEYQVQGKPEILQTVSPEILKACGEKGEGMLVVDDLVDTGVTLREVRHLYPAAHLAAVYAKKMGALYVDTYFLQTAHDTWIYLPWDTDPSTLVLRPSLTETAAKRANQAAS